MVRARERRAGDPLDLIYATRQWSLSGIDEDSLYARALLPAVQGTDRLWYCGQGYVLSSHEEVCSGFIVAEALAG